MEREPKRPRLHATAHPGPLTDSDGKEHDVPLVDGDAVFSAEATAEREGFNGGARVGSESGTEAGCFACADSPNNGFVAVGSTSGRQASVLTISCCDNNPAKADACAFAWAGTGKQGGVGAGAGAGVGRVTNGRYPVTAADVPMLSRVSAPLARLLVRCVVPFLRGCQGRMRATGWHLDARIGELRIPLTITMGVASTNKLFPHARNVIAEGETAFARAVRDPAGGEIASSDVPAKRFTAAAEARIHRNGVDIVYEHDILLIQYMLEEGGDEETKTSPPSAAGARSSSSPLGRSEARTRRRPTENPFVPHTAGTPAETPVPLFVPVVQSGHMGSDYATFGKAWNRRIVRVFIDSDNLELFGVNVDFVRRAIRGINAVLRGSLRLDVIDTKPADVGRGYVHIRGHLTSCMSHLGCVAPSVNAVTLASWAGIGSVVHQLFHTLGLTHPHSAHHRDAHIHVLPQNIARQYLTYFARRPEEATQREPGEYDISSVMHCHPRSYAKGAGLTTVAPRNQAMAERAVLPMGQREEPTEKDVTILRRLYQAHTDVIGPRSSSATAQMEPNASAITAQPNGTTTPTQNPPQGSE